MPKVKRVPPVLTSVPTSPSSSPSTIIATALRTEPCASTTAAIRPSTISEKYSGAPNDWPTRASGGANSAMSAVATRAGEERAERGDGERRAGAALARHLVAVDAGHDRRGLARQVDQDRGGRAAVLRAVVDAGQHDQAGHRLEIEGERQQHRDGGDRADAGQHADQRADQAADEARSEVGRRQRDAEAEGEVAEKAPSSPLRPDRDRAARGPRRRSPTSAASSTSGRERVSSGRKPRAGKRADADQQQVATTKPEPLDG